MEEKIWEFANWIYSNYGRAGCAVAFLIMVATLTMVYILLNRLPEPKTEIVWSKCSSCKYNCRKSNVFVLACPMYEKPRWNQLKSPPCPRQQAFEGCNILLNQSNPAIFKREDILKN